MKKYCFMMIAIYAGLLLFSCNSKTDTAEQKSVQDTVKVTTPAPEQKISPEEALINEIQATLDDMVDNKRDVSDAELWALLEKADKMKLTADMVVVSKNLTEEQEATLGVLLEVITARGEAGCE